MFYMPFKLVPPRGDGGLPKGMTDDQQTLPFSTRTSKHAGGAEEWGVVLCMGPRHLRSVSSSRVRALSMQKLLDVFETQRNPEPGGYPGGGEVGREIDARCQGDTLMHSEPGW